MNLTLGQPPRAYRIKTFVRSVIFWKEGFLHSVVIMLGQWEMD
jgi:hypothetical protein